MEISNASSFSLTIKGGATTVLNVKEIDFVGATVVDSGGGTATITISAGGVTSVSNANGTLTISPTTGAVVASLALGHANTWTGQQTFNTSSTIFGVGVITPKIYPASDSTTAVQILKADGTTNIMNFDTTNSKVGIGTDAPSAVLDVNGVIRVISATNFPSTGKGMELYYDNFFDTSGVQSYDRNGASFKQLALDGVQTVINTITNGNVGIRTSAPMFPLDVNGDTNVTGNVIVIGASTLTFQWTNNTTAPGTQALLSLPLNTFGAGSITSVLGTPDDWALVNVNGTDYKIPLYLP